MGSIPGSGSINSDNVLNQPKSAIKGVDMAYEKLAYDVTEQIGT